MFIHTMLVFNSKFEDKLSSMLKYFANRLEGVGCSRCQRRQNWEGTIKGLISVDNGKLRVQRQT